VCFNQELFTEVISYSDELLWFRNIVVCGNLNIDIYCQNITLMHRYIEREIGGDHLEKSVIMYIV
jgi:hypothetical protein